MLRPHNPNEKKSIYEFARELAANTTTHDEWLAVVRYGLTTLLENQLLLIEIVSCEAEREAAREAKRDRLAGQSSLLIPNCLQQIFRELNLRLEVTKWD